MRPTCLKKAFDESHKTIYKERGRARDGDRYKTELEGKGELQVEL